MHILIVDDYEDMAETLAMLIVEASPMSITTDVGHNGVEAIALAILHPPGVAILDIDMPIMGGIAAASAIKARLPGGVPLFIAVTGNKENLELRQMHAVFDVVMAKPVDIDRLLEHLTDDRSGVR